MKKDKDKKNDQQEQDVTTKSVCFFVQSISDTVVKIDNTPYNEVCTAMPATFWIEAGPDGFDNLCMNIDDSIISIDGEFKGASGEKYNLTSVDFVGGRPPHR